MPGAAQFTSDALTEKRFLVTGALTKDGGSARLLAGQTSDLTRTHEHPPGTVLAYYTVGVGYVRADHANADHQAAAAVAALVTNPGSGGWDGTVRITAHWGTLDVALSANDTNTSVRDAIIAALAAVNPEQGVATADLTGSGGTERVRVVNRDKGKGTYLHVVHTTVTTMFGAAGTGANGTDPKVRVTRQTAWLLDGAGVAQDFLVDTVMAGDFDTSELSGLTAEARAVLEKAGSQFD